MNQTGAPKLTINGQGLRMAIVAASWHEQITDALIASAERTLTDAGAEFTLIRVPGSFELPVVAAAALAAGADAVVALGVIIRGSTPHFEYISAAATDGLSRVALDHGKAIGFGVLTLDNEQQGLDRAGLPDSHEDKGREAAEAAILTARTIAELVGNTA